MGNRDHEGIFVKNKTGEAVDIENPLPVSDVIYKKIKFDPHDRKPDFIGFNLSADALDTDPDWEITRILYVGAEIIETERRTGSWADRATLFP